MGNITAIKQKTAELRDLVEKTMLDVNPETSHVKAVQQAAMHLQRGGTAVNVQIQNIVGQQVIFNLTMCLAQISEIERQLDSLQYIDPADTLESLRTKAVLAALENNGWVQARAADQLGISRRAINYAVEKYGIKKDHWRTNR